ncbi:MAG: GNAT family N-acetyltransferase [Syntrophaceae bacterium]|nr:GNAT family N-acetyltransferase [Syntrophaceae bacterium]
MAILIRAWQEGDIPAVRRILWESWRAAYGAFVPERDLAAYFQATYCPESLLRLYETSFVHGLIAEFEGEPVGFARTQYHENEQRLYLASLYLLPCFQGRGAGCALLKAVEERAQVYGLDEFWVGVMVKNVKAGHWYERRGFRFLREEPFRMAGTVVSHRIGVKRIAALPEEGRRPGLIQVRYPAKGKGVPLGDLAVSLWEAQRRSFPALQRGSAALEKARLREIAFGDWRVRVQFNPQRIASTGASVDPEAIRQRPCFLCQKQLPPEQQAILYRETYLILANPMPIFPRHLTVAHLNHQCQSLDGNLEALLQLAADLGPSWTVFYNGPRAGASAPDHLHFQAAPAGLLPVEAEVAQVGHRTKPRRRKEVLLWRTRGLGRGIVVLEGRNPSGLATAMGKLLEAMRRLEADDEEPRLNLLVTRLRDCWRLFLFPRRKFRPVAYFKEGEERLLISPGAVDMAGILVTPQERDFLRLDGPTVAAIYGEVAYDDTLTADLIDGPRR